MNNNNINVTPIMILYRDNKVKMFNRYIINFEISINKLGMERNIHYEIKWKDKYAETLIVFLTHEGRRFFIRMRNTIRESMRETKKKYKLNRKKELQVMENYIKTLLILN